MPPAILYYITGHGYGHAGRSIEVIRTMLALREDLQVHIRTAAAAHLFGAMGPRVHYEPVVIDRGCIETDPLRLDWPATLRQVQQLLAEREAIVQREAAFVRQHGIGLIAADIPFLAGEVAHAAGVPCWGACNFTWDWIYEPYVTAAHGDLLQQVTRGYERMAGILRYPFAHPMPQFQRQIDVPLMVVPAGLPRQRVVALLNQGARARGIDLESDPRPRVLIAMRGGLDAAAIERAAAASPDLLLLSWMHDGQAAAENLLGIPADAPVKFHDALQVGDVVVSKLGHGIITDCIARGIALLWPPRSGFREDAMVVEMSAPYLRQGRIEVEDFETGNWRPALQALLARPKPASMLPTDGIPTVASLLLAALCP